MTSLVIDNIPHCPCCTEPMVETPADWQCLTAKAVADLRAELSRRGL